jgi:hypothetical protein
VPPEQFKHFDNPSIAANNPDEQSTHVTEPGICENLPFGHERQAVSPVPLEPVKLPGGHKAQEFCPDSPLN